MGKSGSQDSGVT